MVEMEMARAEEGAGEEDGGDGVERKGPGKMCT